jgi:hypothetical protein
MNGNLFDDTTKLIGVDPDTKGIACVAVSDDGSISGYQYIKRRDYKKRWHRDYDVEMNNFFSGVRDIEVPVYIEDIFCRNRQGYKSLAHVQGEIVYTADVITSYDNTTCDLSFISPSTWQAWLRNRYRTKHDGQSLSEEVKGKDCIWEYLSDMGLCGGMAKGIKDNNHLVDAFGIAIYALVVKNGVTL